MAELHRVVVGAAYWRLHPRVRRWAAELPKQQRLDEAFDRDFGVDTAGEVRLEDAGVAEYDVERGHGYYRPVWTYPFRQAIEAIPSDLRQFTFVDYGSGKGKALLLASDYPFREIVGIEFAPALHEVPARNIERYASATQRCHAVRSECRDALQFAPPLQPLVCFFFNPFDDATMAAVLDRLQESVSRHPRDVFIVYTNMRSVGEHEQVLRDRRGLVVVARQPLYLILKISASIP